MNGLCLFVTHPDFVENEDGQRAGFLEGLRLGWPDVQAAQQFDIPFVAIEDPDRDAVAIYFGYGENGVGVRQAEEAAAAIMATISLYVARHNHGAAKEVIPAYAFAIARDVAVPDVGVSAEE